MSITKLIIPALVLVFSCSVYSQNQQFKHYSVNDGLSQSVVNCIYQDKIGFLWFGTQNGLNKFDGYSFTKYNNDPTDTTSISDNWIYDICEDATGNLIVATKKGINILNKNGGHFTRLYNKSENRETYGLFSDNHKKIFINKLPFLLILNSETGKIDILDTKGSNDGLVNDQTIPVLKDTRGNIWQATTNGLFKINAETKEIEVFSTESVNSISNNYVSALYEDNAGNIWIGTRNGLNIYETKENRIHKYYSNKTHNSLSNNFIRSVVQDNEGNMWIGTEGGGLNKSENNEISHLSFLHFRNNPNNLNTISHDIVLSLYIDNSNILWIGTLQGIDKLDLKDKKFRVLRKTNDINSTNLLDNVIASIYKENETNLWIGNWGKGLNLVNRKTNEVRHFSTSQSGKNYISNDFVHVLFKAPDKTLWIGTRNGISVFSEQSDKFISINKFYKNDSLAR